MQLADGALLDGLRDQTLLQLRAGDLWSWVNPPKYRLVTNPANGDVIARVPCPGACEANKVVQAASIAWRSWRLYSSGQRAALLRRWHDLVLQSADDLALIITSAQGKPLADAHGEVIAGAAYLEWFAEEAKRIRGEILSDGSAMRSITVLQPIGVCAAITPWNFPLSMITRKVAPALAAGCPVIVKPAEQTPLTAMALSELARRAGIPPGVFNVLTADATDSVDIGSLLCSHAAIKHISFTGSTEVGRALMSQVAPGRKKLALELGGHAPFIVFDDADFDAAVQGAMSNKFRNAGQTCVAANRLYVHDRIYDEFLEALVQEARQLKVGNGFESGISFGPLMHEDALQKAERHVEDALSKGARLLIGGGRLKLGPHGHRFFQPTVLADATADMLCAREETFGPIAPVFRFQNEAEVLFAANATEFGLAAYLYSRDIGRITRMAEALEFGMVGVNTGRLSSEAAPFGGVKQSGQGREGSRHGIVEYLASKTICLDAGLGYCSDANREMLRSPDATIVLA